MKVLVTELIREEGLSKLRDKGFQVDLAYDKNLDQIKDMVHDYEVMIVRSLTPVDKDMIDAGKKLKIIAMGGIGLNHIDVKYAESKGIKVINMPTGSNNAVAELTVGMMLNVLRRVTEANAFVKTGKWDKTIYIGREIKGKTVGILALGRIGFRVAEILKAFGANIVTYDPYIKQEIADKVGAKIMSLEEVMKVADIVTVHSPLTPETKHMVDAKMIGLMKKGSYIFNLGRGGVVDEEALYDALKSGHLAGAGFDVLEDEEHIDANNKLYKLDNFVITPHIGAGTVEAQIAIAEDLARQIIEILG